MKEIKLNKQLILTCSMDGNFAVWENKGALMARFNINQNLP